MRVEKKLEHSVISKRILDKIDSLTENTTHYAIRIGIGKFNTLEEIENTKNKICTSVKSIKEIKI